QIYQNTPSDYFAVGIGMVIVTAMQWILVRLLNENVRHAREELLERQKAQTIQRQREAILSIVARAAERLLESADWRAFVPELLKQLGEATLASHAYIFENTAAPTEALSVSQFYEWDVREARREVASPAYQNIAVQQEGLKDWYEAIGRGRAYYNTTQNFPARWRQANPGIKTLLDVPIFTGERLWGVIGFDDYEREMAWSQAEVDALMAAAKMLGAAIQRQQAEQDLRASRKELQNKNEELERFTYTVSHDLKSPLITIRGFLGYLEEDARLGDMDRLQEDSRRIVEATDKMSRLLNELLELSRVGRIVNPPETVPFEEIVREALRSVEGRLAEGKITVAVAPGLPEVRGDRVRLAEAIQNLVDNAAKFMGAQARPKIEIGARQDVRPVVFFVKDNGMGIQPEYAQRVFRLFDKIDPRSDGTGVGLAIVKRIIEVHGGSIWVESAPGEGAAFYFTLNADGQ
ncbi:MAG: ATP-binding protein, partial [Chloroflexota bacterium]